MIWKRLLLNRIMGVVITTSLLSGCTIVPGMHVNESTTKGVQSVDDISLIPVTPELLSTLASTSNLQYSAAAKTLLDERRTMEPYKVGPNDELSIIVWDHPELNNPTGATASFQQLSFMVSDQGKLFYPYAGEVMVQGKTIPEVRKLLTDKLSHYVVNPVVNVTVLTYGSQFVNVIGAVTTPARVPLTNVPLTIMDAIALSGGPTPYGDLKNVLLTHKNKTVRLNLNPMSGMSTNYLNTYLHAGDIVRVNDFNNNTVYVLGEVGMPQVVPINVDRLSLSNALATAGGLNSLSADAAAVYVLRVNSNGEKVAYKLDAFSPTAMLLANQFPLQNQDVVYVGTYNLTTWNRVFTQLLPTAQTTYYGTGTQLNVRRTIDKY